ncbi:MAG: ABC transporter permease [Candidatus Omnitrophica bacterium]|nr:ABC transporter permease [bacterium]MBK7495424.1 ABC transporter permease [Candidatus Omnitrophota bacterium]MBV6480345.1 Autoinducer 2 import system permease protein LsrD [bacterium]MCE7906759.1 ABC transporter permease [Candidatus Omnitrophica bacterium COP1]MCL4734548.1 ABC transporter permease [Candidatus Omnitrophota bacterium]
MKIARLLSPHEWGLLVLLLALMGFFSLTTEGFLDPWNLSDRSRHLVEIGLIAVPMTFIICTAGIDISVGSMMILSAILMGTAWRDWGFSMPWAAAMAIGGGTLAGFLNGVMGSYLGIAPLVVTLATRALYRGLALGISNADPIRRFPPEFLSISESTLGYVPYTFLLLVVVILAGHLFLKKSWIGRYSIAIGANETAAVFSAIPVRKLKLGLYAFSGLMCGLAAPIYVARFATANPEHAGTLELDTIAAVVVGGTRITGGSGSVLGTGLGLLVVGTLRFGLDLSGFPQQGQTMLMGCVVIVMAILNEWTSRRRS